MKKIRDEEIPLEHLTEEQLEEFLAQMGQPIKEENINNIQEKFVAKRKNTLVLRKMKKRYKTALLVAALFVLIPTTVFAASKLWEMFMSKQQYEANLTIKPNGKVQSNAHYKLELGYLPANMKEIQTNSLKYAYNGDASSGGISFLLWQLNKESNFSILNVKDYSETTFGDRPAWLIQEVEQQKDFNRLVYIAFEEEGYMLQAYVGKDVTDEEMAKVLNQLKLTKVPENEASSFINFDDYQKQLEESEKDRAEMKVLPLPKDSQQLFAVGEKIPLTLMEQDGDLELELSIDSIDWLDSIEGVEILDYQLEQLVENQLIDDNGNFLDYEMVTYQEGDGKQTTETKIKQEKTKLTYILLTVTIENKSKIDWVAPYMHPHLNQLEESNDSWVYPNDATFRRPYGSTSYALTYLDHHGEGKSYFKMTDMKPKEKRQIKLGYLVPETDLDSLFIDLFNYGQEGNIDDLNAKNRWWVDLRQTK